jgi:hypothetical protein
MSLLLALRLATVALSEEPIAQDFLYRRIERTLWQG